MNKSDVVKEMKKYVMNKYVIINKIRKSDVINEMKKPDVTNEMIKPDVINEMNKTDIIKMNRTDVVDEHSF